MEQVVISGIARTAGGSYGGSLATKTAPELGGVVIREAVRRAMKCCSAAAGKPASGQTWRA
jgi:acetyl-CoA acetyltransferase